MSNETINPLIHDRKEYDNDPCKGLEFPVMFIPGIGFMPSQTTSERDEIRLLYIAMTRAIDQLVITGDRSVAKPGSFRLAN